MKIYFDSEFTGLIKNTDLISIGCIAENGRQFYAEFTDYNSRLIDDWLQKNVIENLLYNDRDHFIKKEENSIFMKDIKPNIKNAFESFILDMDSVTMFSDISSYDWVLFCDLWGGALNIPDKIDPFCRDIGHYLEQNGFDPFNQNREKILEKEGITIEGTKHNSLYDAKVIKALANLFGV